jgi:DNA-binding NtrC family response regulator
MSQAPQRTILVVEDDAQVRELMVWMLREHDLTVLEAQTAEMAMALLQEHRGEVDLAIIDLVMPGASGLDLAAEMGREHPTAKILYISGYGSSIAMESILRRSPESALLKPFTMTQLAERVSQLLGASDQTATTTR